MNPTTLPNALQADTVSAQVVRRVLDKINAQQLRPGDSLESEVQLSRDLAVSRGSVREAYRILAALGVLEIGNGRAPRVHSVNAVALAQIFTHALHVAHATPLHVLEFRRGVEVHAAQQAARFATESQRAKLRALIQDMRASLKDEARRVASDMAIHTTLAEASNNPLNSLVLSALHQAISQSLRMDHTTDRRTEVELIKIIDAHEAIIDRVCAQDAVGAGAAMSYHFDLSVKFRSAQLHPR